MTDPSGRYEHSDAAARPLVLFGLGLALLLAGAMAGSAWLGQALTDELGARAERSPVSALRKAPEGPELQAIPARELAQQRAWEERLLTRTEWVDATNRIVRIPIEDAMRLTLAEGFPVRAEAEQR